MDIGPCIVTVNVPLADIGGGVFGSSGEDKFSSTCG
jgi:hypothetical protein